MHRKEQSLGIGILAVAIALSMTVSGPARASVSEILKMCGRDHGLCVLIGCGEEGRAALAAELASSGKMLVHGIALDDDALARAREAISAAGVDGLASVEKLPLKPLPYRDNLANIVVVEDLKAAIAAGFSRKEALRVVAPFGTLCIRKDGKWEAVRKPLPKEMDEWTHEAHGPDGNCVSTDTVARFPVGFRWHAGLPMNLQNRKRTANAWSNVRGLAVVNGRCFTLSTGVLENLGPAFFCDHGLDQYVTARDAFSGLFLWRTNIGSTYYGGLFYANRAPFAAVGDAVYAATGEGRLVALSAATGEVTRTFATTYAPGRLLIDQGVIAVATWKDGAKVGGTHGVDRRRMDFSVAEGTVEAFDTQSGHRLWKMDKLATSIRSKNGILFMVQRTGADTLEEFGRSKRRGEEPPPTRPKQAVGAVELKTGKQLWEVTADKLGGTDDYLRLDAAGLGVITVAHNNGAKTTALSAKDGKQVFQATTRSYTAFHNNSMHVGGSTYNASTGEKGDASSLRLSATICTPRYYVNDIIVSNRGGGFIVDGKSMQYGGARGGCLFASVPSYGAFYTPQNWCACAPAQIPGFIVFGPIAQEPTPVQMAAKTTVERGPAFGALRAPSSESVVSEAWPTYRGNSQRGNATASAAPESLDVLWQKAVAAPAPDGPIGCDWRHYLNSPVTAPVAADGMVVMAAMDRNQLIALDAATGRELWRCTVGGRVDTPPTIYRGLCLFGSHDGYVYAVSCKDGRLAWRMRAAPREERMVSYGKVESPWPVIGTVLVADGLAYVSAGRTQGSDGGIVVRAFDPATGEIAWSQAVAQAGVSYRELRRNDLLLKVGETVQLMLTRLDLKTGESRPNLTHEYAKNLAQLRAQADLKRRQEAAKAAAKAAEEAQAALLAAAVTDEEGDEAEDEEGDLEDIEDEEDEETEEKKADCEQEGDDEGKEKTPGEIAPTIGLEGFISWHWTRLGNRKYRSMGLGNLSGNMISWGDEIACASTKDGRSIQAFDRGKVRPFFDKLNNGDRKWELALPDGYQATALVVCRDAVIIGGGVHTNESKTSRGFIQVLSSDKGQKTAEHTFSSPLTYNGLAIAAGKVYATFADGSAVCLGRKPEAR